MKRRILLVDDEVAVLLTLKAVLEISGYDVDTASSAREGKSKLKSRTYDMVITDMRMESEQAGREVIVAARTAPYHPAVALLTAYPMAGEDAEDMGADKMLVKPMQTRALIQSIEKLLASHEAKLKKIESAGPGAGLAAGFAAGLAASSKSAIAVPGKTSLARQPKAGPPAKKAAAKQALAKKTPAKKTPAKKAPGSRKSDKKAAKPAQRKAVTGVVMPKERALPAPKATRRLAAPARPRLGSGS